MTAVAPILGFFEVAIWLLAIGQVMGNVSNVACYLAYGVGFALGNYLGILIEEKVAAGTVGIRIITQRKTARLPLALEDHGYGVTTVEAQGGKGPVTMMYAVVPRKRLGHVVSLINRYNPHAFYSIEGIRTFDGGNQPSAIPVRNWWQRRSRRGRRKGK